MARSHRVATLFGPTPSSSNRLSPFSHYHRHHRLHSRCSLILIRTRCRCQSSIPRASHFRPSSPRGGRRPSAPRCAMCGALNSRRGHLRATTSRRGRSGRLVAHDCLVVLPSPRLVVVSPSVMLPPTILLAPAPLVIRRLSSHVDIISSYCPSRRPSHCPFHRCRLAIVVSSSRRCCLVVLLSPRLVVVSPSITLPPTILRRRPSAPAPLVIRRLSCLVYC